jgi:acetyl esterase/lipase
VYEASNPYRDDGELLDVYSPSAPGAYPVVVMLHGSPQMNSKASLSSQARAVAKAGAVVFVPSWGHFGQAWPDYERGVYAGGQVACAVAFARAHASDYGGDPTWMIVFGHSGGGSAAVGLAFNRPAPSADCPGGSDLGTINTLVGWDPDWLSLDPGWDELIAADPRLYQYGTPWQHIAEHPDLPVALVTDGIVGPYVRNLSGAAGDAFWAARDSNGELHALAQELGYLDDGKFDIVEMERMAAEFLKRQGNPVSLDVMPNTTHDFMSADGMSVFLDVFERVLTAS